MGDGWEVCRRIGRGTCWRTEVRRGTRRSIGGSRRWRWTLLSKADGVGGEMREEGRVDRWEEFSEMFESGGRGRGVFFVEGERSHEVEG